MLTALYLLLNSDLALQVSGAEGARLLGELEDNLAL